MLFGKKKNVWGTSTTSKCSYETTPVYMDGLLTTMLYHNNHPYEFCITKNEVA